MRRPEPLCEWKYKKINRKQRPRTERDREREPMIALAKIKAVAAINTVEGKHSRIANRNSELRQGNFYGP